MEYFKASGADIRTKVEIIKQNKHKHSISAMCQVLGISRSSYYYEVKKKEPEIALEQAVIEEFAKSRNNYGTRKLKKALKNRGLSFLVAV